jgi:hypothetical protein
VTTTTDGSVQERESKSEGEGEGEGEDHWPMAPEETRLKMPRWLLCRELLLARGD